MQRKISKEAIVAIVGVVGAIIVLVGITRQRRTSQPQVRQPSRVARQTTKKATPAPVIKTEPTTESRPSAETPQISLSQAVGQRIIFSYEGYSPPDRLKELIRRGEVGGIIIFKRNVASPSRLAATLNELQSIPRPAGLEAPLLVMIDQEGGRVKRLPGPPERSPQAIGRKGSTEVAREEGVNTGRYLKSHGVNVNLAPLMDVARPGTYQERSLRSYGSDANLVASMADAFATGLLQENVVPCFKHFPGLGMASTDEDMKVNRLDLSLAELNTVDEAPFKRASANSMVMTSTALYPKLDDQPALFSKRIVTGELRDKLGFKGISITDDLEVPAMQSYGSTTERGRKAIEAGNDLLLYCVSFKQTEKALRGLTELYKSKKLNTDDLYATTSRVLAFRTRLKKEEATENAEPDVGKQ